MPSKKIGVWGFGTTGQSILTCIAPYTQTIFIMESQEVNEHQKKMLSNATATLVSPELLPQFLEVCDLIIPSPGIDIAPYKEQYQKKFITELDIFGACVTIPIIAITGSIGKTTTVSLLEQLLTKLGKRVTAVGNIGIPMLSFINKQDNYDYVIIEVSSFQLEHIQSFAPTIATILNILPNHLDRHVTMENYIRAKGMILAYQTNDHHAVLPLDFMDEFWPFVRQQKVHWVGIDAYDYIINALSEITAKENIVIILALLEKLGFEAEELIPFVQELRRPPHRMELVKTWNGITFYNDSKATVIESTLQATLQCSNQPTILLLGGLSKGINRQPLFKQLPLSIKKIICFGAEAAQLHQWCMNAVIPSSAHTTLEDAFAQAITDAKSGDCILLSPSGSSYDLFTNFEERGNRFKTLIHNL